MGDLDMTNPKRELPADPVITDEMRAQVRREDCAERGHQLNPSTALYGFGSGSFVGNQDGQVAHLSCRRCDQVWMVVEIPGDGYDDALARLQARLLPNDPIRNIPPPDNGPDNGHGHGHGH